MITPYWISDLNTLKSLLEAAHLPSHDLGQQGSSQFWGLGQPYYAAIGLERYGEFGLLRSLVVAQDQRQQHWGTQLVTWVENYAQQQPLSALYLLTTSAQSFFERLQYRAIERADLPPALQLSSQVQGACPASAQVMKKVLN
ncbi:arsenic resistance N-acetyltransferase ArsN2 [Thiolinea disciformis]|uniref:arsenic resistance N-acetyltransferase ArsN2 n=1 Tax=Thiolinea disciformis TaxID=125614 RepID=UPI0003672AF3|nr:arsenic resistance N-acetyltransferase ArsN2 [Thiolinea disciformis]